LREDKTLGFSLIARGILPQKAEQLCYCNVDLPAERREAGFEAKVCTNLKKQL